MGEAKMGVLSDFDGQKEHQMCSFMWADNTGSCSKCHLEQMLRDLIQEAENESIYDSEERKPIDATGSLLLRFQDSP